MTTRGIRGATSAAENTAEAILAATRELLQEITQANPSLASQDLASILFTLTDDLDAAYPALAARELGWVEVPLLCSREIAVPGGLPRCIRVLLHWNTSLPQDQVRHIYLREAASLRPDLARQSLH